MAYYGITPSPDQEDRHPAVGAWFLGPKAENFEILKRIFESTLKSQEQARKALFPNDQPFITQDMQGKVLFKENIRDLEIELGALNELLKEHSVPFWSPRYQGHMNMDTSFPAVIGYLVTMLYNPNNVATEASPFTTIVEKMVGQQLCNMLGYHTKPVLEPLTNQRLEQVTESTLEQSTFTEETAKPDASAKPEAWGHITSGGSVANLESIWAARNLKFYALSLTIAINEGPLVFVKHAPKPLLIDLCDGAKKNFTDCSTWELLNLKPETVLNLPQQLYDLYGISQTFLQNTLQPYLIQTKGKDYLEDHFGIKKKAVYFVGTTKHYSWPKGAAIAGIGSAQVVDVPVDNAARMDAKELDKMLAKCIEPEDSSQRTPVYAVVAIMGSTEQGAVDPLVEIVELRHKYQEKGLSFVIHCDAAWGGYFASMIRKVQPSSSFEKEDQDFVPVRALLPYTEKQLKAYPEADSVTIDPHKSGYIPYPAGGLCYRDGRMRYLITWTSPVVFHASDNTTTDTGSIGVYGLEGSKPGAAPVGAWLSHEVIGLDEKGYGTLLGEATFTCTMLYCHWATMSDDESELVVVPFNMLPAETKPYPDPISRERSIREEKEFIRKKIVNKTNMEIVQDEKAMKLVKELGSDLMINAFACNFRVNGKLNEDVGEANYFNQRLFQRTSISSINDFIEDRPIILTSTILRQSAYQGCLTNFKNRLGLKGDQDLLVLINVTMTPWPTTTRFLKTLVDGFEQIAKEELKTIVDRNTPSADEHGFIMQGTDKLHLVHIPMFYMENHRYQLIISGDLPADVSEKYKRARSSNPGHFFMLSNADPTILSTLIEEGGSFKANIYPDLAGEGSDVPPICDSFLLSNVHVVVKRSLATNALSPKYPAQMPFYLYGTPEQQHIEHVLLAAPNIQLASDQVTLNLEKPLTKEELAVGVIAIFTGVHEESMQPLQNMNTNKDDHTQYLAQGLSFKPKETFTISIFKNLAEVEMSEKQPLAKGRITLGASVWADDTMLNENPGFTKGHRVPPPAHSHRSGLEAEHSVYGGLVEIKDKRSREVIQGWEEGWQEAREKAKNSASGPI